MVLLAARLAHVYSHSLMAARKSTTRPASESASKPAAVKAATPRERLTMAAKTAVSLEDRIGYRFADRSLLALALTHAGVAGGVASNERLEFLGDRVLGMIVAGMLYKRFPEESEADLARRFVAAVRHETLTAVAEGIGLEGELKLARETAATHARGRAGMLANAFEALIGALYLDGGIQAAESFIAPIWQTHLDAGAPPPKDAKTALQEWAQGRGLPLPIYREVSRSGPAHAPRFEIDVIVEGLAPARGRGSSKRAAEQAGAEMLLDRLATEDPTA